MRIPLNKSFRIFIIALLATVTLIAVTSAIVSLFYEQAVIRYLKKYLDEHLLTQISVDEIRFRALKGFPNATVEINNVTVLSGDHFSAGDFGGTFADTMLKARRVSFRFDLIMLFNKNYELKKIEITDGFVNILYDKKGFHNLKVWKDSGPAGRDSYSLNLQSIAVSDMMIRCIDLRNHVNLTAYSGKTIFRGTYTDHILSGDARGTFSGSSLSIRNKVWMNKADLEIGLKLINSQGRFRIKEGNIKLNKAEIELQGEYKTGPQNSIDLSLSIPKFGLGELISLLPVKNDSLFDRYRFSGTGSLKAVIKGPVTNPDHLQISSRFELHNCSARNLKTKAVMDNIRVSGFVSGTNAANFRLRLDHFTSKLGRGNISGNLQVSNLHDLLMHAGIRSDIDLEDVQEFIGMHPVEDIHGMLRSDFEADGKLALIGGNSKVKLLDFLKKGTFEFRDAGFNVKKPEMIVQHITGKAVLNDFIYLDSLSVRINENDFRLNGRVRNLNGYLLRKEILRTDITVLSDHFSINNFLRIQPGSPSAKKRERISLFPDRMNVNAIIHAGVFDAGKFRATSLSAKIALAGDSIYVPAFSLKFPDGIITGNAMISQNKDHVLFITCNSLPREINIQQLFLAFNNFTQKFIVEKNVKGLLNGTINFSAQWDSTLHFIPKSLTAKGDLEIRDGELVQFEPMMKLSKYISLEELRLIRFKTLKNEIYIQNRLVTIPEMSIHSSAFNIIVAGRQTFDNVFEYRLNVLLSEVLFNKARKKKKEMDEFMVEENPEDQTTIPLIIAGTPDNFDVKFDRKKAFELTRKNFEKPAGPVSDPTNFRIDWEENKKVPAVIRDHPATIQEEGDFKIEWDDEDDVENNDL